MPKPYVPSKACVKLSKERLDQVSEYSRLRIPRSGSDLLAPSAPSCRSTSSV